MDPVVLYFLSGFFAFPILFVAAVLSAPQFREWANEQQDTYSKARAAGYSEGRRRGRELERLRQKLFSLRNCPRRRYRAQAPMVLVAPHTGDDAHGTQER
jgi:hypothetical protein